MARWATRSPPEKATRTSPASTTSPTTGVERSPRSTPAPPPSGRTRTATVRLAAGQPWPPRPSRTPTRDSSVTFVSVACTGAELLNLTDFAYKGLPPQSTTVAAAVKAHDGLPARTIDALIVTAGVNDLHFSDIIERCASNWQDNSPSCVTSGGIADQLQQLPSKLLAVLAGLADCNTRETYLSDYPTTPSAEGDAVPSASHTRASAPPRPRRCTRTGYRTEQPNLQHGPGPPELAVQRQPPGPHLGSVLRARLTAPARRGSSTTSSRGVPKVTSSERRTPTPSAPRRTPTRSASSSSSTRSRRRIAT